MTVNNNEKGDKEKEDRKRLAHRKEARGNAELELSWV
jgi:hypothetical protein